MELFYFMLLVVVSLLLIATFAWRKIHIKTSALAIVMAIGIVTQGVLTNYFSFGVIKEYDKLLSILNISLWISFLFSLLLSLRNKQFKLDHFDNPINRFGIGTWIASTSICSMLLAVNFPQWLLLAEYLVILNIFFWIVYIAVSILAFRDILREHLWKNVHGILLLTTVSTQSLVLAMNTVFKGDVAGYINLSFLLMGILMYLVSAGFILYRYLRNLNQINVEMDWKNTNCILHGAISITGLAGIYANMSSETWTLVMWSIAAFAFAIVESIEVYRLIRRVTRLGISQGILIYDVSQWSRVFTFGMFYAFTFESHIGTGLLAQMQALVIQGGIWVTLSLIIAEIVLNFKFIFENHALKQKEIQEIAS